MDEITPELVHAALQNASSEEKFKLQAILAELEKRQKREEAQNNFLAFVKTIWPEFIEGAHHRRIAKLFEDIAAGRKKRVIINLAPRHTKSEFASYLFPAWFLGKSPKKKILQISNTAELAEGFGRKVRNLLDSEEYHDVFQGVELRADSKASGRWNTNHNGEYYATGVGAALAGRGADLCIIDDPHTEQEAIQAAFNPGIYDKVYEFYTTGPRQRLQPGGAIIIVQCMVGDTLVLRPDGSEIALRYIQVGDEVATYVAGKVGKSYVTNFQSNGVDSIYQIQTQSGRILRANERHPFLVEFNGERKWAILKDLVPGMRLVTLRAVATYPEQKNRDLALLATKSRITNPSTLQPALEFVQTKDAKDPLGQKQNQDYVAPAKQIRAITRETQTHLIVELATTVKTKVKHALKKAVISLCTVMNYARTTTQNNTGLLVEVEQTQRLDISAGLKHATDSPQKNIRRCLKFRMDDAPSVESYQQKKTLERIGEESCASTIVTTQAKSEGSCVTTAISPLVTEKPQISLNGPQHTSDFITDLIVTITPDGEEEVFDIEVAHTENFIAEGVVSHNTRWSLRDLTGQILENASQKKGADQWEVFEFPAILPSGNPLWPEFWDKDALEAIKAEIPAGKWNAQYQQNPTSDETAIIKRESWKSWTNPRPPDCEYTLMSFDCAFEAKQSADYSAMTYWGVFYDEEDGEESVILLDAWRDKLQFPELKAKALELYDEHQPDSVIIEKKATGAPLIYEMRKMGIPVQEFTPSRGNDKIARLNAIADVFASGRVWAPQRRWAEEVIEETAAFPNGRNDDYVDTVSQAINRIRKGGMVKTRHDKVDDEMYSYRRRAAYY